LRSRAVALPDSVVADRAYIPEPEPLKVGKALRYFERSDEHQPVRFKHDHHKCVRREIRNLENERLRYGEISSVGISNSLFEKKQGIGNKIE
jgi:hypothetical protein